MNPLRTLKELHEHVKIEAKAIPDSKKAAVVNALGAKNDQAFYDLVSGRRKLSPAEKTAIANIYGVDVKEIDWQDQEKVIA